MKGAKIGRSTPIRCVHTLFEDCVALAPHKLALITDQAEWTYEALNRSAEDFATHLTQSGLMLNDRVGILAPRSASVVISVLGVLKAGGSYLLLDPEYPLEWIEFVLADACPALLLVDCELSAQFPARIRPPGCLQLDLVPKQTKNGSSVGTGTAKLWDVDRPVSVTYTSGSAGQPKGVLTTHRAMSHYVDALRVTLELGSNDRYLHTASFAFSSSNRQLLLPLSTGSTVVLAAASEMRDPIRFFEFIKYHKVTIIDLIPSQFRECVAVLTALKARARQQLLDNSVTTIVTASERLDPETVNAWRTQICGSTRLINMYGLTETTGIVTACKLPLGIEFTSGFVPIGRPISGLKCYVLDERQKPVADGIVGELYIAGPTLAQGYWQQPELTAARFVAIDGIADGKRMFRTGDLVRRCETSDDLEYVGRIDDQINLFGFRIEPAEVENCLNNYPGVSEAAVRLWEDSGYSRLVAYVVPRISIEPIVPANLRKHLLERIPSYMVPSQYVFVERMPRTPNRKLDRRALPPPISTQTTCSSEQHRAIDDEDLFVCIHAIWCDALARDHIPPDAAFFDLGGSSLVAVTIAAGVLERTGMRLSPLFYLEAPTLAAMVSLLRKHREKL